MKIFIILLFISILSYTVEGSCMEQPSRGDVNIDISFVPSCTICGIDGEISLFAVLENKSKIPIVVYGKLGWGEIGGFTINIEDSHGNRVNAKSLDDDIIIPSTLDDSRFYATLFSHHALGLRRNLKVMDLFPHPGKYILWLSYKSPVPINISMRKKNFISRESGEISSLRSVIAVVK